MQVWAADLFSRVNALNGQTWTIFGDARIEEWDQFGTLDTFREQAMGFIEVFTHPCREGEAGMLKITFDDAAVYSNSRFALPESRCTLLNESFAFDTMEAALNSHFFYDNDINSAPGW